MITTIKKYTKTNILKLEKGIALYELVENGFNLNRGLLDIDLFFINRLRFWNPCKINLGSCDDFQSYRKGFYIFLLHRSNNHLYEE